MCLAYPMKIISIDKDKALAEAEGIKRKVGVGLLADLRVGDYVMVHAGFAIEKVNTKEAEKTLGVFRQYQDALRKEFKK
ncbi:MAG: HypC/HybG/HupF family hydrogenase formation chaperone [Candidatus Omnitrophota bacterium]